MFNLKHILLSTVAALSLVLPANADTLVPYPPRAENRCFNDEYELPGNYFEIYKTCVPYSIKITDLSRYGATKYESYFTIAFTAIEMSNNLTSKRHLELAHEAFIQAALDINNITQYEDKFLKIHYRQAAVRAAAAMGLAIEHPESANKMLFVLTGLTLQLD